ncbi:chromosomal replication initiator protein DnaA [Lactobacillus delbrueckii subsp. delbrueckii DSM 20074 = JCM 1012]|uniref:chromosomal replication initiator protein DnaA n=1 Tax=Lactobacillus delbrueckii TaxID=1584 RepID=UPI00046E9086|nr:chromosomal replication initiator protein DnaA [Lactobacillus delbrueckii]APP10445.1 chromosomal replication initiation protein DnaA [Lactobacillus delbrueckii subsp. delbrueckii DSM 20074 = JCM 1012]KNZ38859.1 chromosomal replication initiator protein DnaA [Lactobacillus delbrueckii subsp. delbrueckii]KRK24035.1 chromosomal replication initiator protein DnaA [Lactobacillus delbrueckii subsp. delbrueckii DSM 20074 = JCM 1012]MCD5451785.1 chromosomal replication initiator protein DnaA [Lactob
MFDLEKFWDSFNAEMRSEFNEVSYNAWFKNTKPVSFNKDTHELVISVQTPVAKGYWEQNISASLIQSAYAYAGIDIYPVFVVKNGPAPSSERMLEPQPQAKPEKARPQGREFTKDLRLNEKYTFENFIQGEGNKLAAGAALAVADNPGTFYNPLFIFGGVGLGKTHLMQAIGHQMLAERPDAKVVYIQSETFVNDFINSIKNKTQDKFREKYRTADLLLVDDIQFFAKKEGIQEEFFHTFETLYNDQKQIVMTSDRLPTEIPDLSERLVSRFAWGLQVEITPPDLETRIAILRKKAESEGLEIDESTLDYVASQVDTNIRELEGALVKVQAQATIQKQDINIGLARSALADLKLVQKSRGLQISKIQEVVANYFQTSVPDLKGKKRVRQIVIPRQIAMYLSRELTDASLPKIGQEFGGKDHTTVMHACDKIARQIKTDTEIKSAVSDLRQMLER